VVLITVWRIVVAYAWPSAGRWNPARDEVTPWHCCAFGAGGAEGRIVRRKPRGRAPRHRPLRNWPSRSPRRPVATSFAWETRSVRRHHGAPARGGSIPIQTMPGSRSPTRGSASTRT